MGKFGKILFGSALAGAVGATVYTYIDKYLKLTPKKEAVPEDDCPERSYTKIDMDAAKQAAKETAETVKNVSTKAFNVAKDSAKTIYANIKENYGSSEAAEETGDTKEDKASSKFNDLKEKAAGTFTDVKEKAAESFTGVKEKVSVKYNELKEKPEIKETVDKVKEGAGKAAAAVKDAYGKAVESIKEKLAQKDEPADADFEEIVEETAETIEKAVAPEEAVDVPSCEEVSKEADALCNDAADAFATATDDIPEDVKEAVNETVESFQEAAADAADTLEKTAEEAAEAIPDDTFTINPEDVAEFETPASEEDFILNL